MAAASRFHKITFQRKSISFPSRSHPTTLRIEEMLNKITTTSTSTENTICSDLSHVAELYECMNDLLNSSSAHILIMSQQNNKWVDELMEVSLMLLDVCGSIRDMVSEIKDHNRDLLCALRKRNGNLINIESSIMKYNCFRKKMRKDVRGLVASLKQVVSRGGSVVVDSDNHQLAAVVKAVMGVVDMTVSVFNSFLMFLSVPIVKPNRWSIVVSKLVHKGVVACETQQEDGIGNELGSVDAALGRLCKNGLMLCDQGRNVEIARCRLERLGARIEKMDRGFECMFRCLIRTRVSLLNIESMHMDQFF